MKKRVLFFLACSLALITIQAENIRCIHENVRETPYPQQEHTLYINPSPLLVPKSTKQADFLQFSLSRSKDFSDASTILSQPKPWCLFNPHKVLENGIWYWRVRSVSKEGKEFPWSKTYSFTVTEDIPRFVTPEANVFLSNILRHIPASIVS